MSDARDRFEWSDEYLERQKHLSLSQLLTHYQEAWTTDPLFKGGNGFNIIIYTFSALMTE